jgi:hypothetical protein
MTAAGVYGDACTLLMTAAGALKISSLLQFEDDSLHSSHCNADACGHFAQSLLRFRGQTEQNMPVVRQERPLGSAADSEAFLPYVKRSYHSNVCLTVFIRRHRLYLRIYENNFGFRKSV